MIDLDKLKGQVPDSVLLEIPLVSEKFNINTNLRLAHFLSQGAHESGNFKLVYENLYYSATRLVELFPKYFPNLAAATPYNMNPEKIANKVYSNRMGNGNEASGDGWNFRARGFIQLTGKSNYNEFNKHVPEKIMVLPDLVAQKYPLLSAAFFFNTHGLNTVADKGFTDDVVKSISLVINGGLNGLQDRTIQFHKFWTLLNT